MSFPSAFKSLAHPAETLRGGERLTSAAVRRLAALAREPAVLIAGVPVPAALLHRGLTLQGGQGAGKTLTLLRLCVPVLTAMREATSCDKLVVLDVKGDLTAAVLGLVRVICPGVPVHLVNPFDKFGSALDPHEFATDPTQIIQLVHALTYRKRDARTDDFFDSATRGHLIDLVKILKQRAPHEWSWRTLYLIATSYDLLHRVLKNAKLGRAKAAKVVKKTFSGIVSTAEAWLDQYGSAFACWDKSPALSLGSFLRGKGVLLLTIPEDQVEAISPIARLLLRKLKDGLLTDTDREGRSRTTLLFDEYADLHGVSEAVYPFFGRSRSSRVSVCTAWQSWPAVCATHSELTMKGLIDNAAVRLFLGCGPDSAELASRYCGGAEVRRWEESHAYGREFTRTVSARTEIRTHVLPSEFKLPPPGPGDMRVRGYMTASHLPGPVYFEDDYQPFVDFLAHVPRVRSYRPRPTADHWLEPWDDATDGTVLDALFRREK